MKIKELRQKTEKELKDFLSEQQDKLRQIRFDLSAGQIKNVSEVKKTKKIISRILTLMGQK